MDFMQPINRINTRTVRMVLIYSVVALLGGNYLLYAFFELGNIRNIVRTAHQCGVRCIYPFFGVTLRTNQREHFLNELDKRFPDSNLRQQYISYYGNRYECVSPNMKKLWKVFTEDCDRYGIIYNMKSIISAYKMGYGDNQLSFF